MSDLSEEIYQKLTLLEQFVMRAQQFLDFERHENGFWWDQCHILGVSLSHIEKFEGTATGFYNIKYLMNILTAMQKNGYNVVNIGLGKNMPVRLSVSTNNEAINFYLAPREEDD